MELFEALIQSGLITEEQIPNVKIQLHNSSGMRRHEAQSIRFFISENGKPICSVKKVPRRGIYNIEAMAKIQGALQLDLNISGPSLFSIYYGTEHTYFIEEYIPEANFEDLLLQNKTRVQDIPFILNKIFQFIKTQKVDAPSEIEDEINEWIIASKMIGLKDVHIKTLMQDIESKLDLLTNNGEVFTTRDILLKNILFIKDKDIYIVDFDLSRQTHFLWLDLLRIDYYSLHDFDITEIIGILPNQVNIQFLKLIFLLSELYLQIHIFEESYLNDVIRKLKGEILPIYDEIYGTDLNITWLNEINLKNNNVLLQNCTNELKDTTDIQLFWQTEETPLFSEERSLKIPLTQDGSWQTYTFSLNAEHITKLRLDPVDRPMLFEIGKLEMINNSGECIEIDLMNDIVCENLVSFQSSNNNRFLSWSDDPQLLISTNKFTENTVTEVVVKLRTTKDLTWFEHDNSKKNEYIASMVKNFEDQLQNFQLQINGLEQQKHTMEKLIQTYVGDLKQSQEELVYIKGSRSWRWTSFIRKGANEIRKLKQIFKGYIKVIFGQKNANLAPIHQLELLEDGSWKSTGDDPQFVVDFGDIRGWVELTYAGCASQLILLKLYYDDGNGLSEEKIVHLGILSKHTETTQKIIFNLPNDTRFIRLDPGDRPSTFLFHNIKIRPISTLELFIRPIYNFFKNYGFSFSTFNALIIKIIRIVKNEGLRGIFKKGRSINKIKSQVIDEQTDYDKFIELTTRSDKELSNLKQMVHQLSYRPLISILVPVYNVEEVYLRKCIESVINQIYPYWELCLVDDFSTLPHIKQVLKEYSMKDSRIKVLFRETNGHICISSNDALNMSTGEFIALLDHDDELSRDALYENILLLNKNPDADVIYSDEDKITENGERHSPFFKPDWSPDTLLSQMYTCHLSVYRKAIIDQVGGFRVGFEGSQDFDLMLRVSEVTSNIFHIPKILYHWRTLQQSTASGSNAKDYTHDAGHRALEEAIIRRNIDGWVEGVEDIPNLYRIHYNPINNPMVSIIIPTRNMTSLLEQCLNSIFEKTTYENFEIIIVDNGSDDPSVFRLFDHWKMKETSRFRVLPYNIPFNYSKLNNYAAKFASGDLLLLLNNDVEVISPNWLGEMVGQAQRKEIGAVGACLYYPDHTIQHAGVILGLGGVAGHSHKHYPSDAPGYYFRLKMVTNYSAVTAACLMIRKEVFDEVGGLEEELQVAFNDVDFCLKIVRKGYFNVWLPHVQLYHHESKSRGYEDTPEKQRRFNQEINWMKEQWSGYLERDPFYNPNLTYDREDFSLGNPLNIKMY